MSRAPGPHLPSPLPHPCCYPPGQRAAFSQSSEGLAGPWPTTPGDRTGPLSSHKPAPPPVPLLPRSSTFLPAFPLQRWDQARKSQGAWIGWSGSNPSSVPLSKPLTSLSLPPRLGDGDVNQIRPTGWLSGQMTWQRGAQPSSRGSINKYGRAVCIRLCRHSFTPCVCSFSKGSLST